MYPRYIRTKGNEWHWHCSHCDSTIAVREKNVDTRPIPTSCPTCEVSTPSTLGDVFTTEQLNRLRFLSHLHTSGQLVS